MRSILIIFSLIITLYFLNKKVSEDYIFIKTLLSSAVAVLSILLIAVIMLHFSGSNI